MTPSIFGNAFTSSQDDTVSLGAARYRDILKFRDAGANCVVDFVDAGLPSTVCPEPRFRDALELMLSKIADSDPDVLVAEAGASPIL